MSRGTVLPLLLLKRRRSACAVATAGAGRPRLHAPARRGVVYELSRNGGAALRWSLREGGGRRRLQRAAPAHGAPPRRRPGRRDAGRWQVRRCLHARPVALLSRKTNDPACAVRCPTTPSARLQIMQRTRNTVIFGHPHHLASSPAFISSSCWRRAVHVRRCLSTPSSARLQSPRHLMLLDGCMAEDVAERTCATIRALWTARTLCQHGVDIEALDGGGRSALHRAASAGEVTADCKVLPCCIAAGLGQACLSLRVVMQCTERTSPAVRSRHTVLYAVQASWRWWNCCSPTERASRRTRREPAC